MNVYINIINNFLSSVAQIYYVKIENFILILTSGENDVNVSICYIIYCIFFFASSAFLLFEKWNRSAVCAHVLLYSFINFIMPIIINKFVVYNLFYVLVLNIY